MAANSYWSFFLGIYLLRWQEERKQYSRHNCDHWWTVPAVGFIGTLGGSDSVLLQVLHRTPTIRKTTFFIKLLLFSRSAVSNSLRPYGLQQARLPCPLPPPRACWNSCLLRRWCHPTISSSVIPFSSSLQSFPASGSFCNESAPHIRWPKY